MRVLLVNKFFNREGGAEMVMFRQSELLSRHEHQVAFFAMERPDNEPTEWSRFYMPRMEMRGPDAPRSVWGRARLAARMLYSLEARQRIGSLIDEFGPDAAVCHNIYHQISPSILPVLKARGVRTVLCPHDYKLVCPAYSLLTHDGICERCVGGRYMPCIRHRCTGGLASSALAAFEMRLHRWLKLYRQVDVIASPSRFLMNIVQRDGFYRDVPMVHLPNALTPGPRPPMDAPGEGVLFVGRLYSIKGVEVLLRAAALLPDVPFALVGAEPGPSRYPSMARELGAGNAVFTGPLRGAELEAQYARAACLVLPSILYENCPLVVQEAARHGKPSIVSDIGGMAELVDDGVTGLHFRMGDADDLAEKIRYATDHPDEMLRLGRNARDKLEREWSDEVYYERLMRLLEGDIPVDGQW